MSNYGNLSITHTAICVNCGERIDYAREWFHHATDREACAKMYASPRDGTKKKVGMLLALEGAGQGGYKQL